MTSYYYLDDPESETGSAPVPEELYIAAILQIASRKGIKITDQMILKEVKKIGQLNTT